jgi:hypothetical protein
MSSQTTMQTIGVGADYGGHDIAYNPQGQQWNFPLVYKASSQSALTANVSIDGVVTPLSLGQQQVTGSGQVVTIEWKLASPSAGVAFYANPWNSQGIWPIQDNVVSGAQYLFQLNQTVNPSNWLLKMSVRFGAAGSAQALYVSADGKNVGNLPTGDSNYSPTASVVAIVCNGLVGDLFMQYTLTTQ